MSDEGARPRLPRGVVPGGVLVFWLVQLTLHLVAEVPLVDSVLLAVLLVVVPVVSLAQLPLIGDALLERIPAYWGSIVTLWLLGGACWLVGTRTGGPQAIGFVGLSVLPLLVWTVVLTAAGFGIVLLFRQISVSMGVGDTPLLRQLLPRSGRERRVFALLSVAAGTGEEIAYRGYAIPVLTPVLGTLGAGVLTSAVFGVMHGYQGALGVVRTALMGGVLAWGFVASGSLWPAILAHTLIDLLAGIVLGERLLSPRDGAGVDEDPEALTSEG